ncbi:carbohydrate ABC transporter permease [Halanaerobium sp. ST460_2HS_T2]|jgi:ABC-type glycerol-3-phosphate transport system permease component|uniref:carbohydrate ABC transporter permease n=1 Tax=Halanaerobium sp. ST460_2HS_T2 TaxID=2183914 RepID=UPI000DF3AFE4|nr:carbohydrate ABC transporter permease [Halanaerobium sp. ST460_2HS_T2]RCW62460.1 multiple sugar transport system permease protein/raffinose/stachyose/melibiose transport system permease protein/arabinosaccharide transport system permease protein [Halanaerobium sp. ST460_2HS_T2]
MKKKGLLSKETKEDLPKHIGLFLLGILTFYPLFFLIISAFKTNNQFFSNYWLPSWPLHFENFFAARGVLSYLKNSLFYTALNAFIVLFISSLSGYAFSRYEFKGKNFLFMSLMILMMVPGMMLLVPLYSLFASWGWLDTTHGLVLQWSSYEVVVGTFIMRTFFDNIPKEYFEAARLDGASEFRIFYKLALPLARPALGTLAIIDILFTWNAIPWPLVSMFTTSKFPVATGLLTYQNANATNWGVLFAGYTIVSIPLIIVFAFFVDKFIEGLQGGISVNK